MIPMLSANQSIDNVSKKDRSKRIITYANLVTFSRALAIWPMSIYFLDQEYGTFFIIGCIAWLTDILDGWVARNVLPDSRFGGSTSLGRRMDPYADKILTAGLFFLFISVLYEQMSITAVWLFAIVLFLETVVNQTIQLLIVKYTKKTLITKTSKLVTFSHVLLFIPLYIVTVGRYESVEPATSIIAVLFLIGSFTRVISYFMILDTMKRGE